MKENGCSKIASLRVLSEFSESALLAKYFKFQHEQILHFSLKGHESEYPSCQWSKVGSDLKETSRQFSDLVFLVTGHLQWSLNAALTRDNFSTILSKW